MRTDITGIELRKIRPALIEFNESNPRDESEDEIADDAEFERLKDSVYKYGVLVPIVVHRLPGSQKPYRLVDGERRLRAALATNTRLVPAHIAPKRQELDELIQAVHIHMLRKQWKPIAQARVLKKIRLLFRKEHPGQSESAVIDYLKEMMACTDTQLKTLRRVAVYSEPVLKEVEDGAIAYSHLVQFEESLVEPLESKFPELSHKLGKKRVRESLVNKAKMKVLEGTRDLMDCVAPVLARAETAEQKKCVEQLVADFVDTEDMRANEVLKKFNQQFPPNVDDLVQASRDIIDMSKQLNTAMRGLDSSELRTFPTLVRDLKKTLKALRTTITTKLKSIE